MAKLNGKDVFFSPVINYAEYEGEIEELRNILFTDQRNESQLFNPKQNPYGNNLYVKTDLSVTTSTIVSADYLIECLPSKRYLGYIRTVQLNSSERIDFFLFDHVPAEGSVALVKGTIDNTRSYAAIPATANATYMLIVIRGTSTAAKPTGERLEEIVEDLGIEQVNSGYDYAGLPYTTRTYNFDTKEEVDEKIAKNQWTGKTILWMGTSIPEGKDTALGSESAGKSYPEMVGDRLGADVINIALGSSMIRANTRFGDYTDGYSHNVLRAFSATSAEKENLIANWDTIRQRLRDPNTYTTLSDSDKENCRNSSFEVRLLPYLDGTYPMPDLFVIDHGHNDYKYTLDDGSTDIGIEPISANIGAGSKPIAFDSNMFDGTSYSGLESVFGSLANMNQPTTFKYSMNRNCYWGAVNFICTLIYKYNPRARIVFVGNLDDKQHTGLVDAQVKIARDWCCPLIRMWEKLAFGSHFIPGTAAYWGGSGYDLSQKQIYCKDGTHPHSDTSGEAMELYADILKDELKNCH